MKNLQRVCIALDTELLKDIEFVMCKPTGVKSHKNSLGKYLNSKLRSHIPHRNIQVVDSPSTS